MDNTERQSIFSNIKDWLQEAGLIIRQQMNDVQIINQKSNVNDLVTEMDKRIERMFANKIRTHYPEHNIISEEGYGDKEVDKQGIVWLVDPIDGTLNYIHQQRNFAISIAVYQDGIGEIGMIYDVASDVLYSAQKGMGTLRNNEKLPMLSKNKQLKESVISLNHFWLIEGTKYKTQPIAQLIKDVRAARTFGSAALEFAYIAEGSIDAYLKKRLEPWDIAAGMIIVDEVGGKTTNLFGEKLDVFKTDSVLTSNAEIHDLIVNDYLLKAKC